ncbi:hypothetical protein N8H74_05880 [Pseudomonas sp. B2M1-30]|uniref:hypothetical protein n=1 Tax=Pseudomonas TaxID=286 RepID=UPI0021C99D3B|nr:MULTISPECIES: hypothetical protein [Pseudomonas]MCU0117772.1 hypothetical protein [Pseudomonas sp. B2M1-30]MCU7259308.1 hypothetical protein [Pseudomonas koreensis]
MGVIVGIIVVFIALALMAKLLRFIGLAFQFVLGLAGLVALGLPAVYGVSVEAITKPLKLRAGAAWLTTAATFALTFCWAVLGWHPKLPPGAFASLKFGLPAMLYGVMLVVHRKSRRSLVNNLAEEWLLKKDQEFHRCVHGAFALLLVCALVPVFFEMLRWPGAEVAAYFYWGVAVIVQLYAISQDHARSTLESSTCEALEVQTSLNVSQTLKVLAADSILDAKEVETLFNGRLSYLTGAGTLREMEVAGQRWVFAENWYRNRYKALHGVLLKQVRHRSEALSAIVRSAFGFEGAAAQDFIERQMSFGQFQDFRDGRFWCAFALSQRISCCTACGLAEVRSSANDAEWFCSTICAETEQVCLSVRDKPQEEFLADAATNGFVLMASGSAWDANHKLFAAGGQGHGFAAEKVNHRVDRMMGRQAEILGDNNAKNGADRLVQGQMIQTKYCATGARSVGAAFDGQQGGYKYFDQQGRAMQIEVPKDQYVDAVRTLQRKISEGKVPGVSDPKDAVKLIRKGHLTYSQARSITKFGTFESIAYDITEGVVVGAVAGGISFGVSATLFYLKTQDRRKALQVASIQAGKSFGRSLTVYVAAQQLHRVQFIQRSLTLIDVTSLAPSTRGLLAQGMGVSKSGVNKALRGTLISSIAVIAVTTGPDLIKLARGRISKAQFAKNLAVASSGVAGGAVGSIAGGILAAPLGPIGAMVGRTAGGIIGGIVATAISAKLMGKLVQEDRVLIISIIQAQLEYLAIAFMLAREEIDSVNANLEKALSQKSLEVIFAAKDQRRAMANFYLKPVVVAVVRQRPVVSYSPAEVVDAWDGMVAKDAA